MLICKLRKISLMIKKIKQFIIKKKKKITQFRKMFNWSIKINMKNKSLINNKYMMKLQGIIKD